jgi:hypothetical protein
VLKSAARCEDYMYAVASVTGDTHPKQGFFVLKKPAKETNIFVQSLKNPSSYSLGLFSRKVFQTASRDQQDKDAVTSIDSFEDGVWFMVRGGEGYEVGKRVQGGIRGYGFCQFILELFDM